MRLFDVEADQQKGLTDSNQTEEEDEFDTPAFDNTDFGEGWKV